MAPTKVWIMMVICTCLIVQAQGGLFSGLLTYFRGASKPSAANTPEDETVTEVEVSEEVLLSPNARMDDHHNPCLRTDVDGFPQYCLGLADGNYYDPWNPFCGYIICKGHKGKRKCCEPGSWMGAEGPFMDNVKYVCRRGLLKPVNDQGLCPHRTDFMNICKNAAKVEEMNAVDGDFASK